MSEALRARPGTSKMAQRLALVVRILMWLIIGFFVTFAINQVFRGRGDVSTDLVFAGIVIFLVWLVARFLRWILIGK